MSSSVFGVHSQFYRIYAEYTVSTSSSVACRLAGPQLIWFSSAICCDKRIWAEPWTISSLPTLREKSPSLMTLSISLLTYNTTSDTDIQHASQIISDLVCGLNHLRSFTCNNVSLQHDALVHLVSLSTLQSLYLPKPHHINAVSFMRPTLANVQNVFVAAVHLQPWIDLLETANVLEFLHFQSSNAPTSTQLHQLYLALCSSSTRLSLTHIFIEHKFSRRNVIHKGDIAYILNQQNY